MMLDVFQSIIFANIIALLALFSSLYAIAYTHYQNKFDLVISDLDISEFESYTECSFVIANNSRKELFVKNIEFLNNNKQLIIQLDINHQSNTFEEEKYINGIFNPSYLRNPIDTMQIAFPLEKPELLLSNTTMEFLYQLKEYPAFVKIYSNKRIGKFTKHKLIPTNIYKLDNKN